MMTLSTEQLASITGGQSATSSTSSSPDGTAGLKRAADQKVGQNSLDFFGYSQTGSQGVGAEYRRKLTPNISVFANGHVGTKNDKPDDGVMGGIRFDW
ncbi:MAG TPA: hypothetical protein VLX92_30995 [Kofleriaceae bacterium]|nr:hypothetical protein [Kofleriaceae bacterium]